LGFKSPPLVLQASSLLQHYVNIRVTITSTVAVEQESWRARELVGVVGGDGDFKISGFWFYDNLAPNRLP